MRSTLFCGAVLLTVFCAPSDARAQEPRWLTVDSNSLYAIDLDSHTLESLNDSIYRAWVRHIIHRPQQVGLSAGQHAVLAHVDLDCRARKYRVRRSVVYGSTGALLEDELNPTPPWEQPIPGSAAEAYLEFGCALAPELIRSDIQDNPVEAYLKRYGKQSP